MLTLIALLTLALVAKLVLQGAETRRLIMAGERELAERVKAYGEATLAKLDSLGVVLDEGVADIAKIHDLLDESTGGGVDVEGANAALDALEQKWAEAGEKLAGLKAQIDRPEPGDEPPPVEP